MRIEPTWPFHFVPSEEMKKTHTNSREALVNNYYREKILTVSKIEHELRFVRMEGRWQIPTRMLRNSKKGLVIIKALLMVLLLQCRVDTVRQETESSKLEARFGSAYRMFLQHSVHLQKSGIWNYLYQLPYPVTVTTRIIIYYKIIPTSTFICHWNPG